MAQMRVDEVTPSKSGKAWRVKSGGKWYGAFGDSGIEAHVGKLIEAEITTSEKYGLGIAKYKVISVEEAPKLGLQSPQIAPRAPISVPQVSIPNQGFQVAPYWLPMASNVVAHAIAAGLIKEPSDIKPWVFGAMNAAKGAAEGDIGV